MAFAAFAVDVGHADFVEPLHIAEVSLVEEVLGSAGDPVQLVAVVALLLEPRNLLLSRIPGKRGGEQAHVVEGVGIHPGDVLGMSSAHGEAGNRAAGLPGYGPVVRIHELYHVSEGLLEARFGPSDAAPVVGMNEARSRFAGRGLLPGVAVRHDDYHGLGLAGCDQIVHDLYRPAEFHPLRLVSAGSVEKVEHRVSAPAFAVSGRSVDCDSSLASERRAVVPAAGHGAVRHVFGEIQVALSALDHEPVQQVRHVPDYVDVLEVEGFGAVDYEVVAVHLGGERSGGVFPDSVLRFRHVGDAVASGEAVTLDLHSDGLGIMVSESDAVVGIDFRRHHRRCREIGHEVGRLCRDRRSHEEQDGCENRYSFHCHAFFLRSILERAIR